MLQIIVVVLYASDDVPVNKLMRLSEDYRGIYGAVSGKIDQSYIEFMIIKTCFYSSTQYSSSTLFRFLPSAHVISLDQSKVHTKQALALGQLLSKSSCAAGTITAWSS